MSTIVVKNLPDTLHAQLKERAERNHRSMNGEVIHLIAAGLASETEAPRAPEPTDGREALRSALVRQPDGSYLNMLGIDDQRFFDALDEVRGRTRPTRIERLFDDTP